MKTVQDFIEEAYLDCYINTKQVPLSDGLVWFNRAIHDFERKLVQFVKTNFFVNKIQSNIVAGTYIYQLPIGTSDGPSVALIEQFRNILQVWVKYQANGGEYRRATPLSPTMNYLHTETLGTEQSNLDPKFEFVGNKIRIYPTPTENVANGLQIDYQIMKKDYVLTDNENTFPFPWQDYTPILDRLRMYIFQARGKFQEKQLAEADYIKSFGEIVSAMTDIYCSPVMDELPNLNYFKY